MLQNLAPKFLNDLNTTLTINEDQILNYTLPEIWDMNGDNYTISLETELQGIFLDEWNHVIIKGNPAGNHQVTVVLRDQHGLSNRYQIEVAVQENVKSQVV